MRSGLESLTCQAGRDRLYIADPGQLPEQARQELAHLRGSIAHHASQFGLAPIAASTHPFARKAALETTPKERYQALARASHRAIGIAPVKSAPAKKSKGKHKRRKPTVRALKAAKGFREHAAETPAEARVESSRTS